MSDKPSVLNKPVSRRSWSFNRAFAALTALAGLLFIFAGCCRTFLKGSSESARVWVGTWATAPQLVEPGNMPPPPGLSGNTLRQIVCASIGGDSIRVRFSNEFSSQPVTMHEVHIALSTNGSFVDSTTDNTLKFAGSSEVTMQPGTTVTSDPFRFTIRPRALVAITIYFGKTSPDVTGHPGSRTTSYLLAGNVLSSVDFTGAVRTDHWVVINGIDVIAGESAAAVSVVGNSITDGRGSGTNKQNRWTDGLAIRLLNDPDSLQVGVLNMGLGGNCVLRDCLGPALVSRFDRDVIRQTRVRWLIIMEGINDIGQAQGEEGAARVAADLIAAFDEMIEKAHAENIKVYGATLLPFAGSFYDGPYRQRAWHDVNEWIRTSGRFDGVIDLAAALADPADPTRLLPAIDSGDHLHTNEAGHQAMADAVDLTLFK